MPDTTSDDARDLTARNERFIDACRAGSWAALSPLLSTTFSYLDGASGEVWDLDRYQRDLEDNPAPDLAIDQVAIHVDVDTAIVSARSRPAGSGSNRSNRYLDTYARCDGEWLCVHASVWPLAPLPSSVPG